MKQANEGTTPSVNEEGWSTLFREHDELYKVIEEETKRLVEDSKVINAELEKSRADVDARTVKKFGRAVKSFQPVSSTVEEQNDAVKKIKKRLESVIHMGKEDASSQKVRTRQL